MQVNVNNNKRTAEQEHKSIKKLKAKIAASDSIEEAALKYPKGDDDEDDETNIDAELINQAQDYADAHQDANAAAAAAAAASFAQNAEDQQEDEATAADVEAPNSETTHRATQLVLHPSPDKPLAGSEEWHRIRKDNHKEVERRRRETINTGIKELAALLPSPESNKAQILQRAIEFIKRLKENENNNIEKWTLEKLLNDQNLAELSGANEKLKAELERAYREVEHWKKACAAKDEKQ